MYSLVLFLPLLSFLFTFFLGYFWGRFFSLYISIFLQFLSLFVLLFCYFEIILSKSSISLIIYDWFLIDIFNIHFCIFLDSLTCGMLLIVFLISFFVNMFSMGYMSHDPFIVRFFSYLSLFVFFMLL
jgi:NADH:ubiquinone oxidoreductase subunit 5 (subunit L)/multisubunit Na+/H+ antiporter MnhA subunit